MPVDTVAQHTPGQWHLYISYQAPGAFNITADDDLVICQRGIGTPNPDEGIANARLIAAAPDLLASLKALLFSDNVSVSAAMERLAAAKAAIARAEGR